jgi:hypothetical protein
MIIIINHAKKKKLAKLSSILVKHKITCSNWLPWNWVSRVHSHHQHGVHVCLCVHFLQLLHRRNIWVPSKYSYFIPYSCWLWGAGGFYWPCLPRQGYCVEIHYRV